MRAMIRRMRRGRAVLGPMAGHGRWPLPCWIGALMWVLMSLPVLAATAFSIASPSVLFDIHKLDGDGQLVQLLEMPRSVLPKSVSSSELIGVTACEGLPDGIALGGVAGDQQAALFGQACHQPGMAKNTYGTGCFMLMHTGDKPMTSKNNLLTSVAWKIDGRTEYALEGSIFIAGAVVQWLRDGLRAIGPPSGRPRAVTCDRSLRRPDAFHRATNGL